MVILRERAIVQWIPSMLAPFMIDREPHARQLSLLHGLDGRVAGVGTAKAPHGEEAGSDVWVHLEYRS